VLRTGEAASECFLEVTPNPVSGCVANRKAKKVRGNGLDGREWLRNVTTHDSTCYLICQQKRCELEGALKGEVENLK